MRARPANSVHGGGSVSKRRERSDSNQKGPHTSICQMLDPTCCLRAILISSRFSAFQTVAERHESANYARTSGAAICTCMCCSLFPARWVCLSLRTAATSGVDLPDGQTIPR